nr:DUF2946 domain-containing protein [Serpens gallinarum]
MFAMLMIHAGPLYSAIQAAQSSTRFAGALHAEHDPHRHSSHAAPVQTQSAAHGQHHQASPDQPAWLAALELCGYCELLTLNPPLSLALQLVLPEHSSTFFLPLPKNPHPIAPRRASGHPRAPPVTHS